jgi:hypothetical protein
MKLPNLSAPISRNENAAQNYVSGVNPSDWKCTICCMGCNALSGTAKLLCQMACAASLGCSC